MPFSRSQNFCLPQPSLHESQVLHEEVVQALQLEPQLPQVVAAHVSQLSQQSFFFRLHRPRKRSRQLALPHVSQPVSQHDDAHPLHEDAAHPPQLEAAPA